MQKVPSIWKGEASGNPTGIPEFNQRQVKGGGGDKKAKTRGEKIVMSLKGARSTYSTAYLGLVKRSYCAREAVFPVRPEGMKEGI